MLQAEQQEETLRITTLGRFRVEWQGRLLSDESRRASKVWELLKYLVTNRGRDIPTDTLIEDLWEDEEPKDPGRALRNTVYRLRQVLGAGSDLESPYVILSRGFYHFNTSSDYWLDTEEFEQLSTQARGLSSIEPSESIKLYRRSLSLYKGEYLPGQVYADWVLPVRNYYRRLFLETFLSYVNLLKANDDLPGIGAACEQALQVEPLEEAIHLQFIDFLLRTGKAKAAQAQYNYASSLFYREMGVKPSPDMIEAYRRITLQTELSNHVSEQDQLCQQRSDGSYYCEPEVFRFICNLKKQRLQSAGTNMFVAGLQLEETSDCSIEESVAILADILKETLRRGDTFCRWKPGEFLLLLPVTDRERVEKIIKRICERYQPQCGTTDQMLHYWYEPLGLVKEL
jgi:two-component SAPR family response regulator